MILAASQQATNAGDVLLGLMFLGIAIGMYFVPTIVALIRKAEIPNVGSISIINIFLGWTIVGWVVALAMACRSRPIQNLPPWPYPPPPSPTGQVYPPQ